MGRGTKAWSGLVASVSVAVLAASATLAGPAGASIPPGPDRPVTAPTAGPIGSCSPVWRETSTSQVQREARVLRSRVLSSSTSRRAGKVTVRVRTKVRVARTVRHRTTGTSTTCDLFPGQLSVTGTATSRVTGSVLRIVTTRASARSRSAALAKARTTARSSARVKALAAATTSSRAKARAAARTAGEGALLRARAGVDRDRDGFRDEFEDDAFSGTFTSGNKDEPLLGGYWGDQDGDGVPNGVDVAALYPTHGRNCAVPQPEGCWAGWPIEVSSIFASEDNPWIRLSGRGIAGTRSVEVSYNGGEWEARPFTLVGNLVLVGWDLLSGGGRLLSGTYDIRVHWRTSDDSGTVETSLTYVRPDGS